MKTDQSLRQLTKPQILNLETHGEIPMKKGSLIVLLNVHASPRQAINPDTLTTNGGKQTIAISPKQKSSISSD